MKVAHHNNFDFLRLLFALLVIITHSYTLTGVFYNDGMYQITNNQITFSRIGLMGFFTISGYLILESLQRSHNLADYFRKRILRIYPALLVVLVITAVGFSFLSSKYSLIGYFTLTAEPYSYVLKNLMPFSPFQGSILDTIITNPYPHYINGSIWTIRYEFLFYVLLSTLFLIKNKKGLIQVILMSCFVGLYYLKYHGTPFFQDIVFNLLGFKPLILEITSQKSDLGLTGFRPAFVIDFGLFFVSGALLSAARLDNLRNKTLFGWLTFILASLSLAYGFYDAVEPVLFPLLILMFGLSSTKWISGLNHKIGDLSYGVYIYGFMIQQFLMRFFTLDHIELTLATIPIALLAGYFSWNLIEKRALKYKSYKSHAQLPEPALT
jgi:peptidoglycan/LPS O-acetylase OafA/YrhL